MFDYIPLSLAAFLVYLIAFMLFTELLHNTGLGMLAALVVLCLFTGDGFGAVLVQSIQYGSTRTPLFAALAFTFTSVIMNQTGIIKKLVNILNSLVGRTRGGSAYTSLAGCAVFGTFSGSATSAAALVGAITIPWMQEDGWPNYMAAAVNTGNSALGMAIPPSTSMFLLLGLPVVNAVVDEGSLYVGLMCGGLWFVLYRAILIFFFTRRYHIEAYSKKRIMPFRKAFQEGKSSLFIFAAILFPLLLTMGPLSEWLKSNPSIGAEGVGAIDIIIWIPVFVSVVVIIEGHKRLPKTPKGWIDLMYNSRDKFATVGGPFIFSYSASYVLEYLGLGEDVSSFLTSLNLPGVLVTIAIGCFLALVVGPLNSTATVTALGSVSFTALVAAGIEPVHACVMILLLCATEGAIPPGSVPCYVSCGIANTDVKKPFSVLMKYYGDPCVIIAILIGFGMIPIL